MTDTYTVYELTVTIRDLFELEPRLQDVWVEGEISNFKRAASGHLYFTLKDDKSELACVMWRTQAAWLPFEPQHGDAVLAHGRVTVYEARGQYQLYCDAIQPAGVGELNRQFELLKARLDAEGLFAPELKRPIPAFPRRIGIVTSPTTAAFQDIQNVLRRRFPMVEIVLSPTPVQGKDAPPQIIEAIQRLNAYGQVDVILLARGGGSLEDLWCFNDEAVVRAVVASEIPIVTGVGHEIDFTLVDFAAERARAPTPSAAAELVTPDGAALRLELGRPRGPAASRHERPAGRAAPGARRHPAPELDRPFAAGRHSNVRQRIDELTSRMGYAPAPRGWCSAAHRSEPARILRCAGRGFPIRALCWRRGYRDRHPLGGRAPCHELRTTPPMHPIDMLCTRWRLAATASATRPRQRTTGLGFERRTGAFIAGRYQVGNLIGRGGMGMSTAASILHREIVANQGAAPPHRRGQTPICRFASSATRIALRQLDHPRAFNVIAATGFRARQHPLPDHGVRQTAGRCANDRRSRAGCRRV